MGERWLKWRLQRRDSEACRELIRRHHHVVYGHLRRMGADASTAEDLTQDTYSKAWRRIDTLRGVSSLRAWLVAIARNEFLQHSRSRKPAATELDSVPEPVYRGLSPDSVVMIAERDNQLRKALHRLDPLLQETVALHYFQDLTLREVAEALEVPAGTVKSRLNRALESLREELEQEALDDRQKATGGTASGHS